MNQKVVIHRAGGLDQVALEEGPDPVPGEGEARVRILAAGAAFGDILVRQGLAGGRFPVTPGYDLVGIVDALGPQTSRVQVGDRVAALPGTGGQQQMICLHERELVAVPPEVASEKVVATVLNYLTAYQLLTRVAGLKKGDAAFIYGLAGGLGSAMQDIARVLGIKLFGTASGSRIGTAARGGAVVFDRLDPDWVGKVKSQHPRGFDAVFDPVGGRSLGRSYHLLAPGGTMVMLGAAAAVQGGGRKLKLLGTIARFLGLKLRLGSRRVRMFSVTQAKKSHPEHFRQDLAILFQWLKDGQIDPVIHKVVPLREARLAQEILERSEASGKIVIMS